MIMVGNNVTRIEGEPKELMTELTVLLSSFKETLRKEYNLSNECCNNILSKAFEIALMTNRQRKEYLDELEDMTDETNFR